jgi:hypothetical protein
MEWPQREIEERLYEIEDVLAARVSDENGKLHVGVLVRPTTDTDGLPEAILDRIQAVAGAVPEVLDLRVMPLGSTAETRVLRPGAAVPISTPTMTPLDVSGDLDGPAPSASVRTVLIRVSAIQEGSSFTAEVGLRHGERSVATRAEGLATRAGTQRLVAEATASGLDELDERGRRRGIEFVDILNSGGGEIAVVGVVITDTSVDEMVTGSASVRGGNRLDAIARAVLDATNRRR